MLPFIPNPYQSLPVLGQSTILASVKSLPSVIQPEKLRTPVEVAQGMVTVPVNVGLALAPKLLT